MSASLNALRSRYERLEIPTVWVAFALSFLLHLLLLSGWLPKLRLLPDDELMPPGPKSSTLAVRLAPRPSPPPAPPPAPAIPAQPAPAQRTPPAKAAEKVLTVERPSAASVAPRPAETARAPANDDFAAFIEARRRAREPAPAAPPSQPSQPSAPSPPMETEQQRHNRIVAENLGLTVTPSFGADKNRGGGIFQVQRLGIDNAEFLFFGWNKFINRNTQQLVEVRRGDNASIEIAVVRRMIAIIREHESGNFVWQSRRLGRDVSLSARMSDNAGLEDFMMNEFFLDGRLRR